MAARPQAPHKVVDGQCYTVNFWRVSFGDVGKAHGFLNTSNIDAYNTPVAGGRQRCGGSTASEPHGVIVYSGS
jgi:hypothetical protein